MWSLVLVMLAVRQVQASPPDAASGLAGSWLLLADGQAGELVLALDKDDKLSGTIFGDPIDGTYDRKTKQAVFKRIDVAKAAKETTTSKQTVVQIFTGVLAPIADSKPARYTLAGTFKSVASPPWGTPDVEYKWEAAAARFPSPAEALKELEGRWDVLDAQASSGRTFVFPTETGLTRKGTKLAIRGNELLCDGKVVGTLANDFSATGQQFEKQVRFFRRPLLFTLPDGKAVLCAYELHREGLEILYPHTMGRVAPGQRFYLQRPREAAKK